MAGKEDAALFHAAVGNVTPLAEQNRIPPPQPATQARVRATASSHTLQDTLSDSLHDNSPEDYLSNGISRLTLRRLRRSTVQDSLDLHGSSVEAARMLLQQFLFEAMLHQLRCVLVIHGKGINSQGGEAVLRTQTRHWLTQHPQVLAFCAASPRAGGSGAVLILLKTNS
jgi:DNA-nicking Smr family endonuclease